MDSVFSVSLIQTDYLNKYVNQTFVPYQSCILNRKFYWIHLLTHLVFCLFVYSCIDVFIYSFIDLFVYLFCYFLIFHLFIYLCFFLFTLCLVCLLDFLFIYRLSIIYWLIVYYTACPLLSTLTKDPSLGQEVIFHFLIQSFAADVYGHSLFPHK